MTAMYLLLGDPQDPYCLGVQSILERRNHPTRIIPNHWRTRGALPGI